MSMLLDALRKSEKRQRAKALPDIHAEAAPDMDRRTGWPRPLWLALTIAGILVLVSAAWYFWPQADEGMPEGAAVPGAGAGANAQGGAKTQQDGAPRKSGRKPASPVETLADTEPSGDGAGAGKTDQGGTPGAA